MVVSILKSRRDLISIENYVRRPPPCRGGIWIRGSGIKIYAALISAHGTKKECPESPFPDIPQPEARK